MPQDTSGLLWPNLHYLVDKKSVKAPHAEDHQKHESDEPQEDDPEPVGPIATISQNATSSKLRIGSNPRRNISCCTCRVVRSFSCLSAISRHLLTTSVSLCLLS